MAILSIQSQKVTIYDAEGWVLRAPVSSGTTGRETPAGVFSVVQKEKDHHSNLCHLLSRRKLALANCKCDVRTICNKQW